MPSSARKPIVRDARGLVVQKVTEAILATVDALEAERGGEPRGHLCFGVHGRESRADLHMVRAFVETDVYRSVVEDYLRGEAVIRVGEVDEVELLHELSPELFRAPRY